MKLGTTTLYHVLAILYYVVPNQTRIIAKQDAVIIVTLYVTVAMGKPCEIPGGGGGEGGVLPYMGYRYIGMCRCEGYGFQAVYSSIGYINQSVRV